MADNGIKSILRLGLVLLIITACAGLLLGLSYEGTKDIIAKKKESVNQKAYMSVLEGASADDLQKLELTDQPDSIVEAYSAGDAGYAVKVTGSGYGGTIEIAVGLAKDGTVTGVSIVSSSETAGLGQRASEESFKGQYIGKTPDMTLEVTKQGVSADNEIAAISGATITSKAVTGAINDVLAFYNDYLAEVK